MLRSKLHVRLKLPMWNPQEYDQWQGNRRLKKQVLNGEIVVMDCFLIIWAELCRTLEKSVNFTSKELQSASKLRDEKREVSTQFHSADEFICAAESAEVQLLNVESGSTNREKDHSVREN